MCTLYANTAAPEAMRRLFAVAPDRDHLGNVPAAPAIRPRDRVSVVTQAGAGDRALRRMHWGFVLPQTSARSGKPILPKAVVNARDDRLTAAPGRFRADAPRARAGGGRNRRSGLIPAHRRRGTPLTTPRPRPHPIMGHRGGWAGRGRGVEGSSAPV